MTVGVATRVVALTEVIDMFVRVAPVAFALALFAFACDVPPPASSSAGSARGAENANDRNGPADPFDVNDSAADGGTPEPAPTSTTGDAGTTSTSAPAPADCITTCTTSVQAKCGGDAQYCSDLCTWIQADELACLVASPTCTKDDFVRCVPNDGTDPGTDPADDGSGKDDPYGKGGK